MEKMIEGKIVEIETLQLIKKGFEGLANKRTLHTGLDTQIKGEYIEIINRYLEVYKEIYCILPFPLYAVEEDIKYAMIITAIISTIGNDEETEFIISNGLKIKLSEDKHLILLKELWSIGDNTYIKEQWENKHKLKFNKYEGCIGFKEYRWALKALISGKGLEAYYGKFMPKLMSACNNDIEKIKHNLAYILNVQEIPSKINIPTNSIIDEENGMQYTIDVISGKSREIPNGKKRYQLSIDDYGKVTMECSTEKVQTVDYDVFKKEWKQDRKIGLIISKNEVDDTEKDIEGIQSVFEQLMADGIEELKYKEYKGIIVRDNIVYIIDEKLYMCKKDKYIKSKEISNNSEIIAVNDESLYFRVTDKMNNGVTRISTYKLNTLNGKIEACKISFV